MDYLHNQTESLESQTNYPENHTALSIYIYMNDGEAIRTIDGCQP